MFHSGQCKVLHVTPKVLRALKIFAAKQAPEGVQNLIRFQVGTNATEHGPTLFTAFRHQPGRSPTVIGPLICLGYAADSLKHSQRLHGPVAGRKVYHRAALECKMQLVLLEARAAPINLYVHWVVTNTFLSVPQLPRYRTSEMNRQLEPPACRFDQGPNCTWKDNSLTLYLIYHTQ